LGPFGLSYINISDSSFIGNVVACYSEVTSSASGIAEGGAIFLEGLYYANLYAIQFDAFVIPQTLPVGYTNPANVLYNTVTFTGDTCMQLYVPDTLFKNIIGFSTGSYPAAVQSTIYSITSNATNAPNLTPVNSIIMRCSLCDNKYTVPPDVMYSFSPNTTFGNNIVINPASIAWIDCKVGSFTQLDIQFMDQNFNPMQWRDSNICVQLLIKPALAPVLT
jgi:hypothetical protein